MVSERLRALRERIQRRETKVRANRRAKSRRIEKEKPKGATETAQVKAKQAKRAAAATGGEASGLASDAKTLIATELGVSRSEAEDVIEEGSGLIDAAKGQLDRFDIDGDGDTDLLTSLDFEEGDGTADDIGVVGTDSGDADPFGPNDDVGTVGLDDDGGDDTDPFGGFL